MIEYYMYRIYPWIIVSVLLIVFALIRWFYYRKFKSDKVKRGDIVHNLIDNTKSVVSRVGSAGEMSVKEWANKPRTIPPYLKSIINQIENEKAERVVE